MNTGCLKIFKKAAQFDEYNTFIPPHRRGEDIQLFRGDDDDDDDNDDDNMMVIMMIRMFPGCCPRQLL